jgi:hypothetical protein
MSLYVFQAAVWIVEVVKLYKLNQTTLKLHFFNEKNKREADLIQAMLPLYILKKAK